MTTVLAICIPALRLAVIGSDSQITAGEQIFKTTTKKHVVVNHEATKTPVGFGFGGTAKGCFAARRVLKDLLRDSETVKDAVMGFAEATFENEVIRTGGDASGIIVWPEGLFSITTLDMAYEIEPMNISSFPKPLEIYHYAVGSGSPYALGAMHAMLRGINSVTAAPRVTFAETLIRIARAALDCAVRYDRNSSGTLNIDGLDGENPGGFK